MFVKIERFKMLIMTYGIGIAVVSSSSLFLFFALSNLTHIGLTYDEAAFINAALGGVNEDFIYRRIGNIPVMVIPYLGALKSWIYYPVFKLANVTIYSIRIPSILLALVTIGIWFRNGFYLFGHKQVATLLMLVLAADPAFINHVKIDFSPIVLQSLLIALTVYFYFKFLEKERISYLALVGLVLILGVFNKLNFIWFVSAFLGAAFVCYQKKILTMFKKNVWGYGLISGLFLLCIAYFIFIEIIPVATHFPMGDILGMTLQEKIGYLWGVYLETMGGIFPYLKTYFFDSHHFSLAPKIELAFIAIAWLIVAVKMKKAPRLFIGCTLIFLLLVIQLLITPQARNSNHIMILWPWPHVMFLFSLRIVYECLRPMLANVALVTSVGMLILSQLRVDIGYYHILKKDEPPLEMFASTAINQLADYVNSTIHSYDAIASINFGINNQLIAYAANDQVRKKLHEEGWYLFTNNTNIKKMRNYTYPLFDRKDEANAEWFYEHYFRGKHVLVIMFADTTFVPESANFFSFAYYYKLDIKRVAFVADKEGNTVYSLYSAKSSLHPAQIFFP